MATTNRPDTAPPRRAMRSASFRDVRAADAVRMFVRMETHIPMYPAMTEQAAPRAKDNVVQKARFSAVGTGSKSWWLRTKP